MPLKQVEKGTYFNYTHMGIHPSLIMGLLVSLIPFSDS